MDRKYRLWMFQIEWVLYDTYKVYLFRHNGPISVITMDVQRLRRFLDRMRQLGYTCKPMYMLTGMTVEYEAPY